MEMQQLKRWALLSAFVALCACGDDDVPTDAGTSDAGISDAGPSCDGCLVGDSCYANGQPDPANPCQVCDVARSSDTFSANDGASCDDGAFCTTNDVCSAGTCAGTTRDCSDGITCNGSETCDEDMGACVAADSTCEAGEICDAVSDACVPTCPGCAIDDVCYGDGQQNPSNPCEVCTASTSRDSWSDNDGATCDDGLFCTTGDICSAGTCAGPDALDCDDGVTCNGAESCDEDADMCAAGTVTCAADEVCDVAADMCTATCPGCRIDGVCYGDGQLNPAESCQRCDADADPSAWSNRVGSCDDGLYCTEGDACDAGSCVGGAARTCSDGVACNGVESCDDDANSCIPGTTTCAAGTMCDTVADACNPSCGTGTTECDASCVDTNTNPLHCGGCGMACSGGEACLGGACQRLASGCSASATFSHEIAPDLWICAFNNLGNKTWPQTYEVCSEAAGFYMATVGPMTRRGLPTDAQIGLAMAAARGNGHDYITSGHPARGCGWDSSNYESCNGLGYIQTSENTGAGSNWRALTDGNEAPGRSWPSANAVAVSFHQLATLCMNASSDPLSEVFDHRWRSVAP